MRRRRKSGDWRKRESEPAVGYGLLFEGRSATILGPTRKAFATTFLDGWIRRARASGIRILQQTAKTLAAHRTGLLAYYDVMISSGPMEGTNNKIKTMKRLAYGFRDMEFFKLKILAIHETKYALVG